LRAHLSGADLRGADLRAVHGLAQIPLEAAVGDETTVLPDGVPRPASWSKSSGPPSTPSL
jgi:hypothetical protein